jgi:hypothetical protein
VTINGGKVVSPLHVAWSLLRCGVDGLRAAPVTSRLRWGVGVCLTVLAMACPVSVARASTSPVEQLISQCPTSAELAAIDADISIAFESDPAAGSLVCEASTGSVNLTRFQERAYQALRVMREIRFSRALPWTSQSLYDWFVAAIDGIRFRDAIFSFCCDPPNVINIAASPNSAALFTARWMAADAPLGLEDLVALLVHEARHNEGKPHTCAGIDDQSVGELGAWGAEYYLELWEGLYSGVFLTSPDVYPSYYRDQHVLKSESLYLPRVCSLPTTDLSLAITQVSRNGARRGARVKHSFAARNSGPDTANDVFIYSPVPLGTGLVQAKPSQGSCSAVPGGSIACSLGPIAAGTTARTKIVLEVDAAGTETVITNKEAPAALGARVTGPNLDPDMGNNAASFATPVIGHMRR